MAEKMHLKVFFEVSEAWLMILSVQHKIFFDRIFGFFRVCSSWILILVRHYYLAREADIPVYLVLFGLFGVF